MGKPTDIKTKFSVGDKVKVQMHVYTVQGANAPMVAATVYGTVASITLDSTGAVYVLEAPSAVDPKKQATLGSFVEAALEDA